MNKRFLYPLATLAIVAGVLLGACQPAAAPTATEPAQATSPPSGEEPTTAPEPAEPTPMPEPQEFRTRILSDLVSMDPFDITTISDQYIASNVHCGLVKFAPGVSRDILPDLATDWSVSDDGLTWTFNLRDDAQFQKGLGPVTAEDVKYSLDRVLFTEGAENKVYISSIAEVVAVDPTTVELHMAEPQASLLTGLAYRAGYIVPKAAIEEMGDSFKTSPVGCGPYSFDSWTPGVEAVLVRFDDYFGDTPVIQRAVFKVIPDESVAALALESGELDLIITRSGDVLSQLKANPDFKIDLTPSTSARVIILNTSKPPFDNPTLRQAVAYAINKDEIIDLLGGTLSRIDSPLDPYRFATDDYTKYPYDPDKARELIAEAGYPNGLDLDMQFTQLSPWPDIVPVVARQLSEVGIQLNLTALEHGAWTSFRRTGDYTINVQPLGRPPDPDLMLSIAYNSVAFPPGSNMSYYDQIDDLIAAGSVATKDDQRAEIYKEIAQKISEDVPVVPLAAQNVVGVMWNYVEGYQGGVNNELWLYPISLNK